MTRYGLAMISVILLPTALFAAAPLECTYCTNDFCKGEKGGIDFDRLSNPPVWDGEEFNETKNFDGAKAVGINMWWAKKYCLMNEVEHHIYF